MNSERALASPAVLKALKVYPDLRLTKMGPYKKSLWRNIADREFIRGHKMTEGLLPENYQNWLFWNYEMFAEKRDDNPVFFGVRKLKSYCHGLPALWTMSFEDKGFNFDGGYDRGFIRLRRMHIEKPSEKSKFELERELFLDRFGDLAMVERYYDSKTPNGLEEMLILIKGRSERGKGLLIAKIDDTKRWDYQQWYTTYVVGLHEELEASIDVHGPVLNSLTSGPFIRTFDYANDVVLMNFSSSY